MKVLHITRLVGRRIRSWWWDKWLNDQRGSKDLHSLRTGSKIKKRRDEDKEKKSDQNKRAVANKFFGSELSDCAQKWAWELRIQYVTCSHCTIYLSYWPKCAHDQLNTWILVISPWLSARLLILTNSDPDGPFQETGMISLLNASLAIVCPELEVRVLQIEVLFKRPTWVKGQKTVP